MTNGIPRSAHSDTLRRWGCLLALLGTVTLAAADDVPTGPSFTVVALGPTRAAEQWLAWGARYRLTRPEAGRVQFTLQRLERSWQGPSSFVPGGTDRVALGVYVNTGGRAQFGWQSRPFGGENLPPWLDAPPREPGGMTLRSADPLADLRLGALARFSFGGQTSVSLRPRKGGLRLTLQAQW